MIQRIPLLLLALGFGSVAVAQDVAQEAVERVTDLQLAAQRQALSGERALAEGRRALRDPALNDRDVLQLRQQGAERTFLEAQQRANALLDSARGTGTGAAAALEQLATLLEPSSLIDAESRLDSPTAQALAPIANASLRDEPSAADLLPTLDAPQTAPIIALALSLDNNPARIHEWVRKQVQFIPTRGSIQGAVGTLATRRGNATDMASIEIALLRSAGVHARYVRGQVELDAARMQRWLGVDRVEAVSELLSEGGIAYSTTLVGGVPSRFTIEHVWVEAWVDMVPSRGAKHITGDAWVALDAAFKDLRFSTGPDLQTWMALDANALGASINAAALLDAAAGTLSSLGADAMAALLANARARLNVVLAEHALAASELDALLARARDQSPDLPYLMGTHPYRIVAAREPEATLPEGERAMLSLTVRIDDNGLPGASLVTLQQPTVALYGQPLQFGFVPATVDDLDLLTAMLPGSATGFVELPEAVPAYLLEMRGELHLGATVVAQSPAFGMGRGLFYDIALVHPDGTRHEQHLRGVVGETRAFVQGWNGGVSAELEDGLAVLRDRQAHLEQPGAATSIADAALRSSGLAHFAAANVYQDWLAGLSRVAWQRSLSLGSSYLALEVEAPFGVVLTVRPQGVGLSDVSPLHLAAELGGGDERRFARESLTAQSAFGYQLLEQMYVGGARSAARVFQSNLANAAAVHTLRPDQLALFDQLALPDELRTPLRAGLVAGDRATFTASARDVHGWNGQGAQQDYPDARGGTSFVFGRAHADSAAHLTGANVTALKARGIAFSNWLGDTLPPTVRDTWASEVESFLVAGDGLVHLSRDPRAIGLSPTLSSIIAGSLIHHAVADRIDPLIDQHLWAQLLWPEISIAPILDPIAPTVTFAASPLEITLGQSTSISASVSDNRPGASLSVTADGQTLTLVNGALDYTPTTAGIIALHATGRDVAGNVVIRSLDLSVLAPGDASAPVVKIDAPLDDTAITSPTDVFATISDDSLVRWTLYLRPGNSPEVTPIKLAEGTQNVTNAKIGVLDPTMMFNGVYLLILEGEDAGGRKSTDALQVRLDGDMKLGQFSISFVDAEVPLAGIPIRITRTYDTRQSHEDLDFGHGWSVDYQNVRLRESRKLGFSWVLQQQGGGFGPWCVKPAGSPLVTVTLPDGETEQFRAKFEPECSAIVPTVYGQLVFEAIDAKTQSKLVQTDYGQIRWANLGNGRADLIDISDENLAPIDPSHYQLTTEDGTLYVLDQAFGVRAVRDQAGNQLTFNDAGITHSAGTSIEFIRDAQGRISAIVLPDGRRLNYDYNAAGDLVAMRDQADHATRFAYLANPRYPHYLEDIIDARGIRAARNEYDDNGRLVATIDANNERMEYTHDIAGHVEYIKNRRGYETTYVFDDNGWVLSETNALHEQTTRTYDPNGNEKSITDPLLRKTEFVVDARGNVLEEKDPMFAITKRTYGPYNQLYTETDAMLRPVSRNRYAINLLTGEETGYLNRTTDALNHHTELPVDICGSTCPNSGNLLAIIDPLSHRTDFSYDRNGNVVGETDANGQRTTRTYDAMGHVLTESRTRIVNGQTETLTTSYTYDEKGQLTKTTHPDLSTTKTAYNAIGKVISETDAANRTTRYDYDNAGRQWKVTYPDNRFETTEYDPEGNEIAKTDRAGRTTKMVYDPANRLLETIYPDETPNDDSDNPRTKNEYDDAGQLEASVNELNRRTTYEYDDAGRQTKVTNALLQTTSNVYDASGRRTSSTDALNRTVKFKYDLAGKLEETIYPDPISDDGDDSNNPRTTMVYDDASRKTAEIDELGRKTTFAYDNLGRLTGVTLAAHTATPFTTTYAYDELGQKLTQTDALSRVTAWTYDRNGRNLTRKLPMGQIESFAYNNAGERTGHTNFNGATLSYDYDDLGRIDTITFPDQTTRVFTYNVAGQIEEINDRGAIYRFAYDERDRLKQAIDAQGRVLDYRYDDAGNRTELTTPSSTIVYDYDELNRLSEVVANLAGQGTNQRATYHYDAVGNRDAMTQTNGSTVSYIYDRRNRLSNLAHRTAAGVLMLGLSYSVDASGLRTGIVEQQTLNNVITQTRSTTYGYDALKRLTSSNVTGRSANEALTESFTYDKVGNRLSRTCTGQFRTCTSGRFDNASIGSVTTTSTFDANDRLSTESDAYGVFNYTYDANGNTLTKRKVSINQTVAAYTWDIENRLVEATLTPTGPAGNTTTTRYAYDPNGIRRSSDVVAQTVGANAAITKTHTHFLVDPNQSYAQVLEDWTATATQPGATEPTLPDASLQNTYIFGDDLIAEARYAALPTGQPGTNPPGAGGNDPTARIGTNTGTSALHYDGLGSTRLLSTYSVDTLGNPTASNETITDQYAYTAFGESDLASTITTTENNYRFTGEQLDPNLGFYYLRARYMNPGAGRFVSQDTYAGNANEPITLHKYLYANANPVTYLDPSGNSSSAVGLGAAVSVAGILTVIGNSTSALARIYRAFKLASGLIEDLHTVERAQGVLDPRIGPRGFSQAFALARTCMRSGAFNKGDCRFGQAMFLVGDTTPRHRELVTGAIAFGAPMFLNRRDPSDRRGIYCPGSVVGDRLDCDEYPYASSQQGTASGHWFAVLNTTGDNRSAGALLGIMYTSCGIKGNQYQGDPFGVLPVAKGHGIPTVGVCM